MRMPLKALDRLSDTKRSVTAITFSSGVCSLLGAGGGILVAGMVTPETLGQLRAYGLPLMYLTCLHMGTFDGLQRLVPLLVGKGENERAITLISTAGAYNFILSCLLSCVFIAMAVQQATLGDYIGATGWLSQAIAAWAVIYGGYLQSTYRTLSGFVSLSKCHLTQAVVGFTAVVLVPLGQFYGLCLRIAVISIVGVTCLHRMRPNRKKLSLDFLALRQLIRNGFPFAVWGSMYTSLWIAAEGTLVLTAGGVKALGFYGVAVLVRDGISILPQALQQVLAPQITKEFGRAGVIRPGIAALFKATWKLIVAMVLVTAVAIFLLEQVLPHVLPEYVGALPAIYICLLFPIVAAAGLPLSSLVSSGNSWRYGRGVFLGLICFFLSAWVLSSFIDPVYAVLVASLLGKLVRTIQGYCELAGVVRSEITLK